MNDRLLLAQLSVDIRGVTRAMQKAGLSVDRASTKMGNRWEKNNKRMVASSKKSARLMTASFAGIGIGAALTIGARTIADFRQAMSTVQAITGATGAEFQALELKARDLGATTRFSATQAAEGMIALGRAGFDTQQVLASIEGTLLLAQAGALELGEAADIASNVLQGFRLEAAETGRVVDVLAASANSSNTTVQEMGQAMSFVAPIAATMGLSIEETAGAVSTLSNAGIKGQRAGAGLRQILIELSAAGHDFSAEAGGLTGVIDRLSKGTLNSADSSENLAAAVDLVKKRQAASLIVLADGVDQLGALSTAYEGSAGSAQRAADIMDDNLNGALLATKSRLQEMQIALGEAGGEQALIDGLEVLQNLLIFVAENADTFNKALIILSATTAGLIGAKAIGGGIVVLKGFSKTLLAANVAAGASTFSLKGLTVATRTFLAALGPIGIIATAAGFLAALALSVKDANASFDDYHGTMGDITKANSAVISDTDKLKRLHEELAVATAAGGEAAVAAKGLEIAAINERISKNKELIKIKREILAAEVAAGADNIRDLERDRARLGNREISLSDDSRKVGGNLSQREQEVFESLLKGASEAAGEGRNRTKAEKKAQELASEILQAKLAFEEAKTQAQELDKLLNADPNAATNDAPARPAAASSSSARDTDKKAEEKKAKEAAALAERIAKEVEAIREIGRTELEQIELIKQERLASIEASTVSAQEKAKLAAAVEKAALDEVTKIRETQAKAIEDNNQNAIEAAEGERLFGEEKKALLLEIEAANARMHGRAMEAAALEFDAQRVRLQAELNGIDEVAAARAAADLARLEADEENLKRQVLADIESLSRDDSGFAADIQRINDQETQRLAVLESFRTKELEQIVDFEAEKTKIEEEASKEREEVELSKMEARLDMADGITSGITDLLKASGLENTKAAKVAAKAQAGVAIGQAIVNTAQGVTKALADGPAGIPAAIGIGVMGGLQVATIAAQNFATGGVDIQGPGTTTSDSIQANLSKGESVITARATQGNEQGLRGLNAGLTPQQAFGLTPPSNVTPSLSAPRSTNTVQATSPEVNVINNAVGVVQVKRVPMSNGEIKLIVEQAANAATKRVAGQMNSKTGVVGREFRNQNGDGQLR